MEFDTESDMFFFFLLFFFFLGGGGGVEPAGFQFQNINKEQMILERQFVTYIYI